ncbi:MAG: nuclear transport factor 2 family protein [Bacteroidota bacterium]
MAVSVLPIDVDRNESWSDVEAANVKRIVDFVYNLMNAHEFSYVLQTYGDHPYVQHNRNIPDGIDALVDYVNRFAKRFPDYTYDVKRVHADGDYVTFHSHATVRQAHRSDDTKGLNIIDTWRVVDDQVVEHWDAIQPLDGFMRFYAWMAGGAIRNRNGVF